MSLIAYILLVIFVLAQAADCYLTAEGLQVGLTEQNPMGRWLISKIGLWPAMVVVKIIMTAIVVAACWYAPEAAIGIAGMAVLVMVYIVGHNYQLIRDRWKWDD